MKVLFKKFKLTLTYKIMFSMILLINASFLVIASFYDIKTSNIYEQNLKNANLRIVNQYVTNLEFKFNTYYNMLSNLTSVSRLKALFETVDNMSNSDSQKLILDISKELNGIMLDENNKNEEIVSIMVYCYNSKLPIITSNIVDIENCYYPNYMPNKEDLKITNYEFYKKYNGQNIMMIAKPIISTKNPSEIDSVVVLEIDIDTFFKTTNHFDENLDKFLEVSIFKEDKLVWQNKSNINSSKILKYEQEIVLPFKNLTTEVKFENSINEINKLRYIQLLTLYFIVNFIALIICFILSNKFTKNITNLVNKINEITPSNLKSTKPSLYNIHDIAQIDIAFSEMVTELQLYIEENYTLKIAEQQTKLNLLQNQINPHFLYNTLETIDALAIINGNFEISDICSKLGQIFRYNISGDKIKTATVYEEIAQIENYIYIQKFRFKDRFNVNYDIDENTLQLNILKFILQPLVENSIVHALENKQSNGLLQITIKNIDNNIFISIKDNGSGFDENILKNYIDLINGKNKNNFKNIGLANVITRIKIFYKNNAKISITSPKNSGTEISFLIPIIKCD